MRNTIDYSSLKGDDKERRALLDILEFIGTCQFIRIVQALKANPITEEYLRSFFSMMGIEGYPVTAFIHRYNGYYFTLKGTEL